MDINKITKLSDGSMKVEFMDGCTSIIDKTDELFQLYTVFYILNRSWTK